ncbi:uncharacterized protein M6G45_001977 [Spheniscus humboldti]
MKSQGLFDVFLTDLKDDLAVLSIGLESRRFCGICVALRSSSESVHARGKWEASPPQHLLGTEAFPRACSPGSQLMSLLSVTDKILTAPELGPEESVLSAASAVLLSPCQLPSHKPSCFILCEALYGPPWS